jgi:hypothetical protein
MIRGFRATGSGGGLPPEELEARIRAALRRQAEEVEPSAAPAWPELIEGSGAVVVSLRSSDARPALSHRGPERPWLRPALTAAAVLVIVLGVSMVVQYRSGGDDPPAAGHQAGAARAATGPVIPYPGDSQFDRVNAAPLEFGPQAFAAPKAGDPSTVAKTFLESRGLGEGGGREVFVDDAKKVQVEPATNADGNEVFTANVWWSVRHRPYDAIADAVAQGSVFLRGTKSLDGIVWAPVGAFTQGTVGLTGVRRGGGSVSFSVHDYLGDPLVRVRLGGKEVVHESLDDTDKHYTLEDPAPDSTLTVELEHLIDGDAVSITMMAIDPEEPKLVGPAGVPVPTSIP